MRKGTVLRGCIIDEERETEAQLLEKRVDKKVNEISAEVKKASLTLLNEFTNTMCNKIDSVEEHRTELNKEFDSTTTKLQYEVENCIKEIQEKHNELLKREEEQFLEYIRNCKEDIKELILILFKKFFYTEYQNPHNLNSLIEQGLRDLEESKNIKISIQRELLNKITEEDIARLKRISEANLEFTSHTKENLLLEMKSERESLEYDFNKQLEKIKEIVVSF